jgi:small GTP-binding protein
MTSPTQFDIKVCIIGDTDVGKTSFSMRYCHGAFPENVSPTIGASFLQRKVIVGDVEVSLQIWDTAGQERFRSMAPMYYRGARAAVLVFDITNEESFTRVSTWLRDLRAHADPDVVIVLAGNKCDKTASFDLAKCEEEATKLGCSFFRTSALTGEGINEVFECLSIGVVEAFRSREKPAEAATVALGGKDKATADAGTGCC